DTRRITPVALVVHAATEHIAIRTVQTNIVGLQIRTGLALVFLVHQYSGMHGGSAGMTAEVDDCAEGMPLIENVVDDQYIAIDEGDFRLGLPEELATTGFIAITRGVQIGQLQRKVQSGQEFAGKDQAAIHYTKHNGITLGQINVDPACDRVNSGLDFGFSVKAVRFGHDLADMCKIDGHEYAPER